MIKSKNTSSIKILEALKDIAYFIKNRPKCLTIVSKGKQIIWDREINNIEVSENGVSINLDGKKLYVNLDQIVKLDRVRNHKYFLMVNLLEEEKKIEPKEEMIEEIEDSEEIID